jgi:predicted dehydrogenase
MKNTDEIRWGILGCGDVCEVKSGPAFNKVPHSRLAAVMRRDKEKVTDFARRHNVAKYYTDADALINDEEINAIYVATPPDSHEDLAIRSMRAGKPVYIEKPVALNSQSCERIAEVSDALGVKACVAHYRRGLPIFRKVRSLLREGAIGKPGLIISTTLQAPGPRISSPGYWRIDPLISGGGLFFDLAPHQLDIFYWLFGEPKQVTGLSLNQRNLYAAPDLTTIEAVYEGKLVLRALWAFNVAPGAEQENCEIFGEEGKITFSFFRASAIELVTAKGTEKITHEYPENIQQPMIGDVVRYFRGEGANPCSLKDALVTMRMMDGAK